MNGGYSIQIDVNANGSYNDPVDRTIPWGSPPGQVQVPFDGLDGLGNPIGVCQPMNAKVVVDRVGEVHLTLDDVETLGRPVAGGGISGGIQVIGATAGVTAPNPKLYWDDTNLTTTGRNSVTPVLDGKAGVDTSVNAAHAWLGTNPTLGATTG